ncbi:jg4649 [Pararge aegeria aegeria]|uniref:Jg4649 protein n=1 Tax=Pararge aegeria aegeria TaxID=348720 RepID=A0A8S4RJ91_9NEOP|nr:jg4649 [Pararge aegeria aegeria]
MQIPHDVFVEVSPTALFADETPSHVMLECTGVTEQCEIYLGSPATIPEVLSNLGGMLGFWYELGWLE